MFGELFKPYPHRLCHVYLKNTNNLVIADFGLSRMCEAMYYRQHRNIGSDAFVVYPPEVYILFCLLIFSYLWPTAIPSLQLKNFIISTQHMDF